MMRRGISPVPMLHPDIDQRSGVPRSACEHIVARPVAVVQVKGKHQYVQGWEPLCLASEDDAVARELARLFVEGLAAYLGAGFSWAAEQYQAALRLSRKIVYLPCYWNVAASS
jgi:hypothetical protein